jgi:hypothetical protein
VEVDPKVHPVTGPFEIAPLPYVTPVLKIAAVRPFDPMARMKIMEKCLTDRRVKQRISFAGETFRVLRTPPFSLFVKVHCTECSSAEPREERGHCVELDTSRRQGWFGIH